MMLLSSQLDRGVKTTAVVQGKEWAYLLLIMDEEFANENLSHNKDICTIGMSLYF